MDTILGPVPHFKSQEEAFFWAKRFVDRPFKEICGDAWPSLLKGKNKGVIGQVIEQYCFGYGPNSIANADFAEIGLELKTTPYVRDKGQLKAKERLVCCMIDYEKICETSFEESHFWQKCNTMLILFYDADNIEAGIKYVSLFKPDDREVAIMENDYAVIQKKVRAGKAHTLTEGDTDFISACRKGAGKGLDTQKQPYNKDILAKSRAFAFKQSYVTRHVLKPINEEEEVLLDGTPHKSLREFVLQRIQGYEGMSVKALMLSFRMEKRPKNLLRLLFSRMLGCAEKKSSLPELEAANVKIKTVHLKKGKTVEHMSFRAFKFADLVQEEEWEQASFRDILEPCIFLFVVFSDYEDGETYFDRIKFWNIPSEDLQEIAKVWKRARDIARAGVEIRYENGKEYNNLPKGSESRFAHVRPHGKDGNDKDILPDGRPITRQCFWLNKEYIESILAQ